MSKYDTPTCTHCGTQLDQDELWGNSDISTDDGDDSEIKCENSDCGKIFYVQCTHEIFFFQVDADGDEIH